MTLLVFLGEKNPSISKIPLFGLILGSPLDLNFPVYIIAAINTEVLPGKSICHWKLHGMKRPLGYVSSPSLPRQGPELHCSQIQGKE